MLAGAMRRTGMLRLLERLARRPCLVVLVYHRVGDAAVDGFYSPLISATAGAFQEQMRWARRNFETPSLEEILDSIGEGVARVKRPTLLVTFDDGYRDNLTIAAPIARACGVRPALFVATGFLGGRSLPWWDRVAWILRRTRLDRFEIEMPERLAVTVAGADRSAAIGSVIGAFIRAGWSATEPEVRHLAERAQVDMAELSEAAEGLFLKDDELKALAHDGWSIGAHTRTHRRLAALSVEEQREELAGSKRELEALVERGVDAVAYPYGMRAAFDERTQRVAREAGYRLGVALEPRVIWPGAIDEFSVPRYAVGGADTTALLRARVALARGRGRGRGSA